MTEEKKKQRENLRKTKGGKVLKRKVTVRDNLKTAPKTFQSEVTHFLTPPSLFDPCGLSLSFSVILNLLKDYQHHITLLFRL
ncbi:MAG: hypothetical protein V4671_20515, partial [Armatimonadota bacterium]